MAIAEGGTGGQLASPGGVLYRRPPPGELRGIPGGGHRPSVRGARDGVTARSAIFRPLPSLAIYLADLPDETPGGDADAIRVLCTPDTPAGALEGLVVERLLRWRRLRAANAAFLVDGLLGHLAGMRGRGRHPRIQRGAAAAAPTGRPPAVVDGDPGPPSAGTASMYPHWRHPS